MKVYSDNIGFEIGKVRNIGHVVCVFIIALIIICDVITASGVEIRGCSIIEQTTVHPDIIGCVADARRGADDHTAIKTLWQNSGYGNFCRNHGACHFNFYERIH